MNTQEIKVGNFNAKYPVSKLKQSLVNRDITMNHVESFGKKIKDFGWMLPIIIDSYGNNIEGHHRAMAAEKIGEKTLPVYIVDWVNTKDLNEYQEYIISLNNSNRKWSALDYLKSYSRNKAEYKYVNKKYDETKEFLSVGNVLNIYLGNGASPTFKKGNSKIKNKQFSNFLLSNFLRLKKEYGSKQIQALTINRVCSFLNAKTNEDINSTVYLFNEIEKLAINKDPLLSSVSSFKTWLVEVSEKYQTIK